MSADVNNDASSDDDDDDDDDGVEVIGEDGDYYDDDADLETAQAASGDGDSDVTIYLIFMSLDSSHYLFYARHIICREFLTYVFPLLNNIM